MDERVATLIAALTDEATAADELAGLTDDQLTATAAEIAAHGRAIMAGEVDGVAADDLATLESLAAARAAIVGEQTRRTETAAAEAAAAEAEATRLAALSESFADTPVEPEPAPEEPAPAPEPEVTATAAVAPPRPSLAVLAASTPPEAAPRPSAPARTEARWRLKDGSAIDFADKLALAERILEAKDSLVGAPAGFRDKATVATFKVERPDEMTVTNADARVNQAKIDRFVAPALGEYTPEMAALTASGGWCAPAEPRYDLPSVASAARPVRDGLPRMGATRGSVAYARGGRLSSILANQSGAAITTWEADTDETPGGSTKTRQTHVCRTVLTEEVGAVVARMRFGNFQQRAWPEDVANDLELVAAQHARIAERRLQDALIGDINIDVTQTGLFGTARDARFAFQLAASEIRYTERMGRQRRMRGIVDSTILDMVQLDVVNQQASGETDALLVDEAFARRLLMLSTVDFIYALDTPTGADEFVTNADTQNLADFPDNFEVPIFPDGSAVFVDAGELNIGVVRDSTLNNTNDYEIFYETFEGLLYLGPYAKTVTLTTCPTGESQIAIAETTLCSGS